MSNCVHDCKVVQLSKIHNRAGNITIVENGNSIPFEIRRVYYLYDIPGGETRGGHGHKELFQLIVAVSGSFTVELNDGKSKINIMLNRPNFGLLVVPGIWRVLSDFSSGSVCLVLASHQYDPEDYLYTYDKFVEWKLAQ